MTSTKMQTLDMAYIGLFAVVIAICSWISIPTVVPFTLQTFAVFLAVAVLGGKRGTLAVIVYVLLGAVGLPVFSGFSGGFQRLVGPTGGFLWSFPLMAFLIGLGAEKYRSSKAAFLFLLTLGTVLNYVVGVLVFCLSTQSSLAAGITACVLPFIPTTIIKAVLSAWVGLRMRDRLPAASLT